MGAVPAGERRDVDSQRAAGAAAALGFRNIAADIYWMRAVVYFGGRRLDKTSTNFDQLYPLLSLVTYLDPYFKVAYRFGAVFLSEDFPGGAGRPDQAVEFLRLGVERDPKRWEYLQDIGFIYYWWLHDYRQSAEWYQRAADVPGAPNWMGPLAAVTLAEGGNRESSRRLWLQLKDTADVEWIRNNATHRLAQLDAMDIIDALNQVSQRFAARHGRPPANWRELAIDQGLRGIPVDSTGEPFALDPATGKITLGGGSLLHPLPTGESVAAQPKL